MNQEVECKLILALNHSEYLQISFQQSRQSLTVSAYGNTIQWIDVYFAIYSVGHGAATARVVENDPTWRAGGTTLQGYSTQQFMTAEPIKVDPSRKVELVLRLVTR